MPQRANDGDAGLDLHAERSGDDRAGRPGVASAPGSRSRSRPGTPGSCCRGSGLALRHGIALVNAPGLIDSGYRGELRVLLLNTDRGAPFEIEPGDRIAQLVIVAVAGVVPVEVAELSATARGDGGFGSTGR